MRGMMSSEDVKAEEIFLSCKTDNWWIIFLLLLPAWKGRGEKLFLNSTIEQVVVLFVGCTNPGRRIFWAFHCFSVPSIIWVLQDCWGEVRKCQLMLCVVTIENQRTVFGQSLFASKLFFFFTVLVSAKDEYEQYFLLSRKKMSNVWKKFLQCLC